MNGRWAPDGCEMRRRGASDLGRLGQGEEGSTQGSPSWHGTRAGAGDPRGKLKKSRLRSPALRSPALRSPEAESPNIVGRSQKRRTAPCCFFCSVQAVTLPLEVCASNTQCRVCRRQNLRSPKARNGEASLTVNLLALQSRPLPNSLRSRLPDWSIRRI